ncbi:MAG: serine hydrolase [Planctomycetota bacterium]
MIEHFHENGMFNGAALVKAEGEVIYERGLGTADFRDGTAIDKDTVFYLASVSKQFTAMAIMILADRGELSLEDHLSDYLPEFEAFAGAATIHQLLTHSSGIPDHLNDLRTSHAGQKNEDVLRVLLDHGKLKFEPGRQFSYSNGGYVLLSLIVEEVSGQRYADFVAENILQPLGMQRTFVKQGPMEIPERAPGFNAAGELRDHLSFTTGAGGMYSTLADLATWDEALYGEDLVSRETMELALAPHQKMPRGGVSYGYGWQVRKLGGRTQVSHAGGLAGYSCIIVRELDTRHCVVLLSNQAECFAMGILNAIEAVLHDREPALQRIRIGPYMAAMIRREGIEAAMARYDEIMASEREHFDLGEIELNMLGYEYLRAGKSDLAVAVHRKNAETFKDSANAYDSLGETMMMSGDRRGAIVNYAKSLVLNPDNKAAIDKLQELK